MVPCQQYIALHAAQVHSNSSGSPFLMQRLQWTHDTNLGSKGALITEDTASVYEATTNKTKSG